MDIKVLNIKLWHSIIQLVENSEVVAANMDIQKNPKVRRLKIKSIRFSLLAKTCLNLRELICWFVSNSFS